MPRSHDHRPPVRMSMKIFSNFSANTYTSTLFTRAKSNMVLHKYKLSSFSDTKQLIALDDPLIDELLFTEKLYVFDENGKRIGRFSLSLDRDDTVKQNKIVFVHISNRAYINGKLSESIVTGTVTTKLKTLEEIRYECSEMSTLGKHERCTFILREATKYYVSVTNTICDMKHQTHFTLPFVECLGMIGECSNAVLLRRLATKGYEGILCLKTILSNGKRCKSFYVTKLSEQTVNGKRMQVLIVYRNITNFKKLNITMTMALTRAGQLIYLFWSNSKCFLHIDPDCEINPRRFTYAEGSLDRHWHKDVELHSLYLDKVSSQSLTYGSVIHDSEPLRRILGDFLLHVLLNKPTNIICFAIEYFSAFGHKTSTKCPSDFKLPEDDFEYSLYKQEFGEDFWIGENFYFLQSP